MFLFFTDFWKRFRIIFILYLSVLLTGNTDRFIGGYQLSNKLQTSNVQKTCFTDKSKAPKLTFKLILFHFS